MDEIFSRIIADKEAFFEHQQRGDDELTYERKMEILRALSSEKLSIFLTRQSIIKQVRGRKENNRTEMRNLRFNAMQKLLKEGVFFSDAKMREREPYLFDAMIGKFLNEEERIAHVRPTVSRDKSELTWSVLMDRLEDSSEIAERRNLQEMEWEGPRKDDGGEDHISRFMSHVSSHTDFVPEDEGDDDRKDEVEDEIEIMRKEMERLSKIEADQYDELGEDDTQQLLRQEFEAFMQQKFLAGKDAQFYDYSKCEQEEETLIDPIREHEDEERCVDHYRKYPVNDAMHKNGNNGPAVDTKWFYLGPDKEKYGPYLSKDMNFWLQAGYFTNELQLKTENEQNYHTLGEWTQILGTPPFLNPVHSLEAVAAAAQWQQQVRAAPAPMMVMPPGLQNQFPPQQMRLQYPPFVPMPFLHQMNQNGPPMHSQPPSEPIDAGSLSHTPDSENDARLTEQALQQPPSWLVTLGLAGHGAKPHQSQFHQMHQLTKQMHHVNIATEPIVMKNAECQTDPVKVEISKTNASRLLSELLGQIVVIN
ncbi:hypothetical protein GCK72_018710 [Caenorhabditis remanei]|uniref:GYF domain-containing protein n=2 Tax=Caenorhabditis remanei TaxID=31234 RepID=A0A6A5GBC7_CAERE|nr:hypothetical protein GCK72_018710 [Caenorhabditis remanei]KAF1752156.1 hypothetical protein GCK72_018710 [Caenorhabditis remanei]